MSFYDDASLVFLAGGAAGKDGKAYSVKPVEELSSTEVVINGGFSIDGPGTDGELDTSYGNYGWNTVSPSAGTQEGTTTISNGVLKLTNASGETDSRAYATDGVSSRNVITTNTYYKLVYTIVENNGCTSFKIYNAGGVQEDAPSSVGTHTVSLRNTSNQLFLFFNKTESSSISIDNVSIREITNQAADFTFSRGTNLTATRVGKDGYIEKGREQKLYNTVWSGVSEDTAPSGWTGSIAGSGTFNATSSSGQIRFTCGSSDRSYLQGPAFTTDGPLAISVYVDEVHTACRVGSVIGYGGVTATKIDYYEDGVAIDVADNVQAGKRYSYVINRTDSDNGYPRFGVGIDNFREGDITLSRPQFEIGLAATAYIENTSTSATVNGGVLEDEPRFDYTGGGCPALLIEGNAINLIEHTEYFESWTEGRATVTSNETKSPEGLTNASKFLADANGGVSANHQIDSNAFTIASGAVSASVYAKKGNTDYVRLRLNSTTAQTRAWFDLENGEVGTVDNTDSDAFGTITDMGDGWYRCTVTEPNNTAATASAALQIFINEGDGDTTWVADGDEYIYLYGAQYEQGGYATSYIPNYGTAATASRSYDNPNELTHGITMGTSCSIFLEATNFKVTETGGDQTSFLKLRAATSPAETDRFLFLGSDNTASTFTLKAQNKESGTSTTKTLSKTLLTMGSPFKALARYDGTSFDFFVNGVLEGSETIVADDHFGRVDLKNLTVQAQNGHSISQVILFDSALSTSDSEILTGATSYNSFADMATTLNYTIYE